MYYYHTNDEIDEIGEGIIRKYNYQAFIQGDPTVFRFHGVQPSEQCQARITTTATQPPAAIAATMPFTAATVAFTAATIAFAATLTNFTVACAAAFAA